MKYFKKQLISYLGNKRSLLSHIDNVIEEVKIDFNNPCKSSLDLFSGSGVVSRLLKTKCDSVITNDLELYAKTINDCFLYDLSSKEKEVLSRVFKQARIDINFLLNSKYSSWVREYYAPKDELNIQKNDRVFYTIRNARYLDCAVKVLNSISEPYRSLLWGPLLSKASVHVNTAAMFKGFYKDKFTKLGKYGGTNSTDLDRIKKDIQLELPILYQKNSFKSFNHQENANSLVNKLPIVDIAYLDPPYNQHPYASNYFMLNHLLEDKEPKEQSIVVGIPKQWNRSNYNKKNKSVDTIIECINKVKAKNIILSYSTSGFIKDKDVMISILKYASGKDVRCVDISYTNLSCGKTTKQSDKDKVCTEYLFVI